MTTAWKFSRLFCKFTDATQDAKYLVFGRFSIYVVYSIHMFPGNTKNSKLRRIKITFLDTVIKYTNSKGLKTQPETSTVYAFITRNRFLPVST